MGKLEGKVAIVTGASSGIGRAAARLFACEGAAVIVAARRANELDSLVEDITQNGSNALSLAGDVRRCRRKRTFPLRVEKNCARRCAASAQWISPRRECLFVAQSRHLTFLNGN